MVTSRELTCKSSYNRFLFGPKFLDSPPIVPKIMSLVLSTMRDGLQSCDGVGNCGSLLWTIETEAEMKKTETMDKKV